MKAVTNNYLAGILLLVLSLTACSMVKAPVTVRIADHMDMQLVMGEKNSSLVQKVSATYQEETHVFIMQVQIQDGITTLAGLSPTGTRLFSLVFDGLSLESWKSPLYSAPFESGYVLADYQLTTLDLQRLRRALPADVSLEENSHATQRKLVNHAGTTVITIDYSNSENHSAGSTHYCHHERHYCLDIEALGNE